MWKKKFNSYEISLTFHQTDFSIFLQFNIIKGKYFNFKQKTVYYALKQQNHLEFFSSRCHTVGNDNCL